MFRIDNPSAVAVRPTPGPPGQPGFFTNGNPALAQEATIVDDWWANSIQEEILTVIEQAGLVPNKSSVSQLFEALNLLYQGQGDLGDTYLTIAGWRQWTAPVLTQNTAVAYTITYSTAPAALIDGMLHNVEFHVLNGALATLNVNALGPKPVHYYSVGAWRPIPPGLVGPNQVQAVAYHAGTDAYRLVQWRDTTGDYVATGRDVARVGTILALGQPVSRTDFAGLFAAFGTRYGAGNGSTTFNLPDARGRAVFGADQGAGRLGVAVGASVAGTLGSFGGVEMMQYVVTGNTPSQSVAGNAYVSGTAYTAGAGVHVYGTSDTDPGVVNVSQLGGTQAAVHPHNHGIDIYGQITQHVSLDASGTINGWTSGAQISGQTDNRTNMPPAIVGNYAICL
jgi:microcystin-dependent protein